MLGHWFVLGCPASIKIIAWSLYNIPFVAMVISPPSPSPIPHRPTRTSPGNTPNHITATVNVVGSIIFLPPQIDFIPFSPTSPNPFSLPLTCSVHLIYGRLLRCNSSYRSKLLSLHIEGILLYHLPVPTIKVVFEWDHHGEDVFLSVKGRQDRFTDPVETFWITCSLLSNVFFWCPTGSLERPSCRYTF